MSSPNEGLLENWPPPSADRSQELSKLIKAVLRIILPHISRADKENTALPRGQGVPLHQDRGTALVNLHEPYRLQSLLKLRAPSTGEGEKGFFASADSIINNSVNTWSAGFLDKLYASPDPPGLVAELLLATLNTNAHVYAVSPALTCVEKHVGRELAAAFGLTGPHAGGISVPGGAAANTTSLLVARNVMFPATKADGVAALPEPLTIFVSADAHYSVAVAAASLGLGASSVYGVPVDEHGVMSATTLSEAVQEALSRGRRPFYVCATAGTTVRGAYDPLPAIAAVCRQYRLWLHIDACWGGPAIFSARHRHKLAGSARARTIAINPHKMLGVPVTCSFLLAADLRTFSSANRLSDAGYLFHSDPTSRASHAPSTDEADILSNLAAPGLLDAEPPSAHVFDLASLTPQCGRRADSLKFYLAWIYHGSDGFSTMVDRAMAAAAYLAARLRARADVQVLEDGNPPCAQVCFWYVGDGGVEPGSTDNGLGEERKSLRDVRWADGEMGAVNSRVTRAAVSGLVRKGWMVDFAPGGKEEDGEERGEFLRVVMNRSCGRGIVDGLVKAIGEVGAEVVKREIQALELQGKV